MALAGKASATDPVCILSPLRAAVEERAMAEVDTTVPAYVYRGRKA
jgi:pyrroloquinoline quinone biosynthesis protein E